MNDQKYQLNEQEQEIWNVNLDLFNLLDVSSFHQEMVLEYYCSFKIRLMLFHEKFNQLPKELINQIPINLTEIYESTKLKNYTYFIQGGIMDVSRVSEDQYVSIDLEDQYEGITDQVSEAETIIDNAKEEYLSTILPQKEQIKTELNDIISKVEEYRNVYVRIFELTDDFITPYNEKLLKSIIEIISSLTSTIFDKITQSIPFIDYHISPPVIISISSINEKIDEIHSDFEILDEGLCNYSELLKKTKQLTRKISESKKHIEKLVKIDHLTVCEVLYSKNNNNICSLIDHLFFQYFNLNELLSNFENSEIIRCLIHLEYKKTNGFRQLQYIDFVDVLHSINIPNDINDINIVVEIFNLLLPENSIDKRLIDLNASDEVNKLLNEIGVKLFSKSVIFEVLSIAKFCIDLTIKTNDQIYPLLEKAKHLFSSLSDDKNLRQIVEKYYYAPNIPQQNNLFIKYLNEKGFNFILEDRELILDIYRSYINNNDYFNKVKFISTISLNDAIIEFYKIFGEKYREYRSLFILDNEDKYVWPIKISKEEYIDKQIEKYIDLQKYNKFKMHIENTQSNYLTMDEIDQLNGEEFEQALFNLFSQKGYKATKTKQSGDQGADLIIEKFGEITAVQAKCYSNPVSNKAIQEVVASKSYYNANKAMVVTNSIFTKSAKELALINNVELVDRDKLEKWLDDFV